MDSIRLFSKKSSRGRRAAEINKRRAVERQSGVQNNPLATPNRNVNAGAHSPAGSVGNVNRGARSTAGAAGAVNPRAQSPASSVGNVNPRTQNTAGAAASVNPRAQNMVSSNTSGRGIAINSAANARRNEALSRANRRKKKKSALKTFLIVVMILMFGMATLFVTLGFYVNSLDAIFPNVFVDGVNLSGMSVNEASATLSRMVESTDLESLVVTVSFTSGDTFDISGADAGLSFGADVFDPDAMASELFSIGRGDSFLQNEFAFIRSLFRITDISIAEFESLGSLTFDEEAVRSIVDEHTAAFNSSLLEDVVTINSDSITIIKGSRFDYADPDDVYELVINSIFTAVSEQRNVEIEYTPVEIVGDDVDFAILYDMISVEPVGSVYDPETLSATESFDGVSFDIDAAREMLDLAQPGEEVVIPFVFVPPDVTQEYLEGLLFRDVLGEVTTNMAGSSSRLHNIGLTVEFINEMVLNPGDVFSFNSVVGRRTAERGFREAPGFVGGRLVDMLGGGICQTSSTLYVLTLMANLEVIERRPHGPPISYLPYGQDATVVYANNTDYRFRNSSDFPIRIELETSGRNLTGRILGTRLEDYRIELETRVISETPIEVVRQETEGIYEEVTDRAGSKGVVADVYKRFYDSNDNFLREERVGRTTHHMRTRIILIPMGGVGQYHPPAEGGEDHGPEG